MTAGLISYADIPHEALKIYGGEVVAGARQPVELVIAKGKKHLTQAEISERRATEVKAPATKVTPPRYLPDALKKEFRKVAKELLAIGIISNLDVEALARFIVAQKMYTDLTLAILGDTYLLRDKDVLGNQDKLFKQCRAAASDLGLTISSRCKLIMPKPVKEEKPNKFTRFGPK
jgi:P27 family predicted phage terminase small subunit